MKRISTIQPCLVLVAAVAAVACSNKAPSESGMAHVSQAVESQPLAAVPCDAWARAVTATTGNVMVNSRVTVDSYLSKVGPYGGTNVGESGSIRAGTSIVNNGGTIKGKLDPNDPAALGTVSIPAGAINLPLGASSPGDVNINGAPDSVTLAPGSYVVRNLNINYPGKLNIQPAGKVQIWVTGNLNLGGTENQDGIPGNLTFVVKSSGWVNVNSNGSLYGTIYAPTSGINLNSAVFGSVVGRSVTLNSGAAVHADLSSACAPTSATPPDPLPVPPQAVGCYLWTNDGWETTPCMTDTQVRSLVRPQAQVAIASQPRVRGGAGTSTPLVFGQVESTFVSDVKVTDNCSVSAQCASLSPGGVARASADNTLGFQNNTNYFKFDATGSAHAWVQFVVYADATQTATNGNAICIWDIALSPDDYYTNTKCVGGKLGEIVYTVPKRAGAFVKGDFANIAGFTFTDGTGNKLLGMVTELSWVGEKTTRRYAVVAPDAYGLSGNWYDVSGGFLGLGNGSEAIFTDTQAVTRVAASSCQGDTQASSATCPSQPDLLPLVHLLDPSVAGDSIYTQNSITGETSNLQNIAAPTALVALNSQLVSTEYVSSTGASCLTNGYVYLRDNAHDNGGTPSWYQGEDPFWESPDIFVLPQGSPRPGPNDVSQDFSFTANTTYDVWLRVNNDFGCAAANQVKALIFAADPDVGFSFWAPVTAGSTNGNYVYVDAANNPNGTGESIAAYGQLMMGPYPFTPTTSGHKCLLAAVQASGEGAVAPPNLPLPVAYLSNQVAQRNIQISNGPLCNYSITNNSGSPANLSLAVAVSPSTPAPGSAGGPVVTLTFDDKNAVWYNTWHAQGLSVTASSDQTTLTLQSSHVGLNTVTVPALQAGASAPSVRVSLVSGPNVNVDISSTLTAIAGPDGGAANILVQNGGSCQFTSPISVCPTGQTRCGTTCVDLLSDNSNCGACGQACLGGYFCSGGLCTTIM